MLANEVKYFIKDVIRNPRSGLDWVGTRVGYALRWKKVPFLPVAIDIEPNNTCNFKCTHCQVTYWDKKPAYFDSEIFVKVLKQIPNLMKVKLQGMGEPLLNKQLIPMLEAGEQQGVRMHFHTNGSICDPIKADRLAQLDRTHITYSIDGATAETFAQMRPGSRFNQIVENIQMLMSKRSGSNLLVSAWTVVTQKNVHELPQIIQLAKKLGLDFIAIQPYLTSWGKEDMESHTNDIQVTTASDTFATQLATAKATATDVGIDLIVNEYSRFCHDKPCAWPWKSAFIAANGDVVPCCVVADSDVVKMGNVFEQDFKEIWNSAAYQELRAQIINRDLPEYCKNCYVDP